jgi:hypothetical protein
MLASMAENGGLRLDAATAGELASAHSRGASWTRLWLAVAALSLAAIAIKLVL